MFLMFLIELFRAVIFLPFGKSGYESIRTRGKFFEKEPSINYQVVIKPSDVPLLKAAHYFTHFKDVF